MKRRGFTLVELMIVVSILGILAAIVLPKFSNSTEQAKEASIKDTLHTVRTQIELYKMQHNGLYPGSWGPMGTVASAVVLQNQFIGISRADGTALSSKTPTASYPYGPYLMQLPKNPFNDLNTIKILVDGTTDFAGNVDSNYGWLYERTTGTFKISYAGTDSDGAAYTDY